MGKRIFDARSAPEEEVDGVRQALDEAGIDYYETSAGKWMIGNAAFWVRDDSDYEQGRQVVKDFQARWLEQARANPVPNQVDWAKVPLLILVVVLLGWLSFSLFSL